jgi:uncharacterized repeat protein (TIGR02543 family)
MRETRNKKRRVLCVILTLLLCIGLFPQTAFADEGAGAGDGITVYMDFEGYNLGQGFYIKPAKIETEAGKSVSDVIKSFLSDNGYDWNIGYEDNYLRAVNFFAADVTPRVDPSDVTIPEYITKNDGPSTAEAKEYGNRAFEDSSAAIDPWLNEKDYDSASGWMYTVNNALTNLGIKQYELKDGDVVRFQFSVYGLGSDLGIEHGFGDGPYFTMADKTELIRALTNPNAVTSTRNAALAVIIDPLATDGEVKAALDALLTENAPELNGLEFASNATGTTKLALAPAFDGNTTEHEINPTTYPAQLHVLPKMEDAADYKWRYVYVSPDGAETTSEKFDFVEQYTRITGIPAAANATNYGVKIQIVGAEEDVVHKEYSVRILPIAALSTLAVRYGTTTVAPSPAFNATTTNYTYAVNMSASSTGNLSIQPNSTVTTHKFKINGSDVTRGAQYVLPAEDFVFGDDGKCVVEVEVSGAVENAYKPMTYTLTITKAKLSVTSSMTSHSRFKSSNSNPSQFSVNAAGGMNVTYQWYKNEEESTEGGTPVAGATANRYAPTKDTEGVFYYYCVVTSEATNEQAVSNVARLKIIPDVRPDITLLSPGGELPELDGIEYPDGVTEGFWYSEETPRGDYTKLGLSVAFDPENDITKAPWNCTVQYQWRGTVAGTNRNLSFSRGADPELTPSQILGGVSYTCTVYVIAENSNDTLTYTTDPVYVHIQNPGTEPDENAPRLSGLDLSRNYPGDDSVDLSQAFDASVKDYSIGYQAYTVVLYANPQMADADGYKWSYSLINNNSGEIVTDATKRDFGSNAMIDGFPSYMSDPYTLKIKIVGEDDGALFNTYTVKILPVARLSSLSVGGSASLVYPSYVSTSTWNIQAMVAEGAFTVIAGSSNAQSLTINGQNVSPGSSFALDTADLVFDEDDNCVVPIVVKGDPNRYVDGYYTLTLHKTTGTLRITTQTLQDAGRFVESASSIQAYSVTAADSGETLTYKWYRNTVKSAVKGAPELLKTTEGVNSGTANTYSVSFDTDPGIYYYYCVVASSGGGTATSAFSTVMVLPRVSPEITILTPGDALPTLEGVEYPDGVTEGYYYGEDVDPGEYARLKVAASYDGVEPDLTKAPWSCTVQYSWRRGSSSTGNSSPEITPTKVIGGAFYTCIISVSPQFQSNESLTTEAGIYVHIEDPHAAIYGGGSEDDPYRISTAEQLAVLSKNAQNGNDYSGKFVALTDDVEFNDEWQSIGPFAGDFDGNGYTISLPYGSQALFENIKPGSVVHDLNIYGPYFTGSALAARVATATARNVTIKKGTSTRRSGLFGSVSFSTIDRCVIESGVKIGWDAEKNAPAIQSEGYVPANIYDNGPGIGSFTDPLSGTVTNSVSYATVYGQKKVGGIAGRKSEAMQGCTIRSCVFGGEIIATGNDVGGILGSDYEDVTAPNSPAAKIENCYVTGKITGGDKVGGIYGSSGSIVRAWPTAGSGDGSGYIRANHFYGEISATNGAAAGGIVGYMLGLDAYNIIENNYYIDSCGTDRGVGGAKYVLTSVTDPTAVSGVTYVDYGASRTPLAAGDSIMSGVDYCRSDDPLGRDADKLAKSVTAEQMRDGSVLEWLNSGAGSENNWIQRDDYPSFEWVPVKEEPSEPSDPGDNIPDEDETPGAGDLPDVDDTQDTGNAPAPVTEPDSRTVDSVRSVENAVTVNEVAQPAANADAAGNSAAKKTAKKTVKVKFSANGGKLNVKKDGKTTKAKSVTKKLTVGKKLGNTPKVMRDGPYRFKGWYTKKSGGKKVTKNTVVNYKKTTTLYARWQARYGKLDDGIYVVKVRSAAGMAFPVKGWVNGSSKFLVMNKIGRADSEGGWYKIRYSNASGGAAVGYIYAGLVDTYWADLK